MHGFEVRDGLQLDYQSAIHQKVETLPRDRLAFIDDGDRLFLLERDRSKTEFNAHGALVGSLDVARAQVSMHLYQASDYSSDQFLKAGVELAVDMREHLD